MSDHSQGAGWWQASDDKWYPPPSFPPEPTAPIWPPGAPPSVVRQPWELTQAQLQWKAENRKGLRRRWAGLSPKGKLVLVFGSALLFILVVAAVSLAQPDSGSSTAEPARDLGHCQAAAGVQMSTNGMDTDPKNPAVVEIFSAYVNRCLALRAGLDPCGWELQATSGNKPVAGCRENRFLPLLGFGVLAN